MKMDEVAGSGNDEFFTPLYAVAPILKYVPKGSRVWCPFDTSHSLFVRAFSLAGCEVVATHLESGTDFFSCAVPKCDYIISNPPYSKKTEVLARLFEINKPFAMLVGVVGLFESQNRFDMFASTSFEVMYFNRRVAYFKDYSEQTPSLHPPFSSVYICKDMLPSQIVFEVLRKPSKGVVG